MENQTENSGSKFKLTWPKKIGNRAIGAYGRMGIFTACATVLSNCLTTMFPSLYSYLGDPESHRGKTESKKMLYEHPGFYFGILFYKSFWFGYLWPLFYLKLATNPEHVLTFGGKYVIKVDSNEKIFSITEETRNSDASRVKYSNSRLVPLDNNNQNSSE